MIEPGLREYATEADLRYLDALDNHGTYRAAAKALGCSEGSISGALGRVRRRAGSQGYSPDHGLTHGVAPGFGLDGYSHLTKTEDGEPIWLKARKDRAQAEMDMQEAVKAFSESIPRAKPEKPPQATQDDLAACYVLADAHIGMLAFSEETGGDNWDTDIAEEVVTRWFNAAIEAAPKAHTGILLQLGDVCHFDGLEALTPASKNLLDTDTRFQRLVRVVIRVLRRGISLMLRKHEHVHVIMADANHDPASSAWLRELFAAFYEDDPRVTVDTSGDTYYAYQWGDVSLFAHHGHKAKLTEVSRTFAGKFREIYGATKYSYAHTGHLHHSASREDPLMIVEQHPTLSAMDAYASRMGFVNQRGAHVITYHRNFGEVGRITIRPEMVSTPSR